MIISLCLLLIIVLVAIAKSKNIYSVSLTMGIATLWMLLFALVLYISKVAVYNPLFGFEKSIYLLVKRLSIGYFDITTLVNIAIVMILISHGVLFLHDIDYGGRKAWRVAGVTAVVAVCAVMLFLFNGDRIYEKIYIYSNTDYNLQKAMLMKKAITVSNYVVLGMSLVTYIKIFYQTLATRIILIKRKLFTVLAGTAIVEAMFLCVLLFSPLSTFFNNFNIYDFKNITAEELSFCKYLSVLIVIFAGIILIFANKYHGFGDKKGKEIDKNNILVRDIRHVFHNYKNALYTISLLADKFTIIFAPLIA